MKTSEGVRLYVPDLVSREVEQLEVVEPLQSITGNRLYEVALQVEVLERALQTGERVHAYVHDAAVGKLSE